VNTNQLQFDSAHTPLIFPPVSDRMTSATDPGGFARTLRDASAPRIDSPHKTSSNRNQDSRPRDKTSEADPQGAKNANAASSGKTPESSHKTSSNRNQDSRPRDKTSEADPQGAKNANAASSGKTPDKAPDQTALEKQASDGPTGRSDKGPEGPREKKEQAVTDDSRAILLAVDPGLTLKTKTPDKGSVAGSLDAPPGALAAITPEDVAASGSAQGTEAPRKANAAVSVPTQPEKAEDAIPPTDTKHFSSALDQAQQGKIAAKDNPVSMPADTGEVDKKSASLTASLASQPSAKAMDRDSIKKKTEQAPAPIRMQDAAHSEKKHAGDPGAFQKEARDNSGADTPSLHDQKPVMQTDAAQKKTVDFQSLITSQGAKTPAKESPRAKHTGNLTNPVSEAPGGQTHALHLQNKAIAGPDTKISQHMKPHEVFERSVMHQVVSKASLISKDGKNEMLIHLDPPSLGSIKIQISVRGENVTAKLVADNHVARDILQQNLPQLKNTFTQHGLKIDQMSVNVGNDPGQQAADHFRPFYMERGFRTEHAEGSLTDGLPSEGPPTRMRTTRTGSDGISVFV